MTSRDRAKMERRLEHSFHAYPATVLNRVERFVAREVDRAVRAERKAFRDTEELRTAQMRRKGKAR